MNLLVETHEGVDWVYPVLVTLYGGPCDGEVVYPTLEQMKDWRDMLRDYRNTAGSRFTARYVPRWWMELREGRRTCVVNYVWEGLNVDRKLKG
jgi:hypothetical protein